MTDSNTCPVCAGERWVCENHPEQPWNKAGCECGAEMPCRVCNPRTDRILPALPSGFVEDES